jgi:ribonuclease VapC
LVAILKREPEFERFLEAIVGSDRCSIGAPTLVESTIVLKGVSVALADEIRLFLNEAQIDVIPFDEAQAEIAQVAHRRFGRGSSTKARLNFGDCLAYATSIASGRPLLYKGKDFSHTDVKSAL